jgi:glycosyltransferase involved in cell wall biosynthesis
MAKVTLIATVLNEGDNIHHLMQSLVEQTRQPDEVIIVDGGSTDHTASIIESYAAKLPLRLIVRHGANISEGRNTAIRAASDGIIAVTDAGVRLTDKWLEHLVQPLFDSPELHMVGGFFSADPKTNFEVAMGATVLPVVDEIDPQTFLPSSRSVAFRKSAWEKSGGYPEWLDYCEDLIFDINLKTVTPGFTFAPDALVYFRPRPSLTTFYKQYYRYARGDGKADLWRKRHLIRYLTYLVVIPGIFALGRRLHPVFFLLYFVGGGFYLYQPYRRLPVVMRTAPDCSPRAWASAIAFIPLIRVVGDVAKMIGYPVGWLWRLKNRPPQWKMFASTDETP